MKRQLVSGEVLFPVYWLVVFLFFYLVSLVPVAGPVIVVGCELWTAVVSGGGGGAYTGCTTTIFSIGGRLEYITLQIKINFYFYIEKLLYNELAMIK